MWVGEESPLSPQGFGGRDPRKILIQNPTTPGNFLLYFKFKNLHTDAFLGPKMGTATVRKLTSKALWVRKQNRGDSVFAGGAGLPCLPLGYGPGTPCHPVMTDGHVFQCDIAPVGDATAQ